jgi:glycerophosphoryl diester phosphodiesterase
MLLFAHGSGDPGDELNSPASFDRLASLDIDGIEVDVRRTSDDVLIARHDPLFADGRAVRETRFVDVPTGTATLEHALDACMGLLVNIEIKNYSIDPGFDADERVTDDVLDLLATRGDRDRVIISSFGPGCLRRVRERRPDLPTAVLLYHPEEPDVVLDRVVAEGHALVHPYEPHVDHAFIAAARRRGLTVNAWTMDEGPATAQRLMAVGVDGLITGRPASVPGRGRPKRSDA